MQNLQSRLGTAGEERKRASSALKVAETKIADAAVHTKVLDDQIAALEAAAAQAAAALSKLRVEADDDTSWHLEALQLRAALAAKQLALQDSEAREGDLKDTLPRLIRLALRSTFDRRAICGASAGSGTRVLLQASG